MLCDYNIFQIIPKACVFEENETIPVEIGAVYELLPAQWDQHLWEKNRLEKYKLLGIHFCLMM